LRISTRGSYAMEAVLAIALLPGDHIVSIREISDRTRISDNYLEQIFTLLRKGGIISSSRGAYGGYRLSRSLSEISVGDVLRATEKSISPVICVEDPKSCRKSVKCVTRNVWCRLSKGIADTVDHISLADLVKSFEEETSPGNTEYSI